MRTTGILFIRKDTPGQTGRSVHAATSKDGVFEITIKALDRINTHLAQSYTIVYSGAQAAMFWDLYASVLQPGQPIECWLDNPVSQSTNHIGGSSIYAHAHLLTIAPTATQAANMRRAIEAKQIPATTQTPTPACASSYTKESATV